MVDNPKLPGTRDEFIKNNLNLVHNVCKKYKRIQSIYKVIMDYDDMFQNGCIGLLHAYTNFDGTTKFSTYGVACIRGYILQGIARANHGVYFRRDIKQVAHNIFAEGIEHLSISEIAKKLGIDTSSTKDAMEYLIFGLPISITSPSYVKVDEDITTTLQDGIRDIEGSSDVWYKRIELRFFYQTLSSEEQMVMKYMVEGHSYKSVGEILGFSASKVQKTWQRILGFASDYSNNVQRLAKKKTRKRAV